MPTIVVIGFSIFVGCMTGLAYYAGWTVGHIKGETEAYAKAANDLEELYQRVVSNE